MDLPTTLEAYQATITALPALGLLLLLQLLVVDVLGIRAKHIPGSPVAADHKDPFFRASRAVANSNESVVIFLLFAAFCVLSGASPIHTAIGTWGYVGARAVYTVCYYSNLKLLRSVVFGVSLLFLVWLLVAGLVG